MLFLSLVLPLAKLVDRLDIFGNNELPLAEVFAEHFMGLPTEEMLGGGRPAQHFELVVPLDHGERRVFNVESESPVFVEGGCFGEFAFRNIANDGDAADHFAVFIVTR